MIALRIEPAALKIFMNKLLIEDMFDAFEFREAVISSFIRFELDGRQIREDAETASGFYSWPVIKPYVFNIIKGVKKPRSMKFVFSYPADKIEEISGDAKALFINIIFENENVLITSGCQTNVFLLDKSVEGAWDAFVREFVALSQMPFSE